MSDPDLCSRCGMQFPAGQTCRRCRLASARRAAADIIAVLVLAAAVLAALAYAAVRGAGR